LNVLHVWDTVQCWLFDDGICRFNAVQSVRWVWRTDGVCHRRTNRQTDTWPQHIRLCAYTTCVALYTKTWISKVYTLYASI